MEDIHILPISWIFLQIIQKFKVVTKIKKPVVIVLTFVGRRFLVQVTEFSINILG